MNKVTSCLVLAIALLTSNGVQARSIAGYWVGDLGSIRIVLKISQTGKDRWTAMVYSPDQAADTTVGNPVDAITINGSALKFSAFRGHYEGKIDGKADTITGVWTQDKSQPLTLRPTTAAVLDSSAHTVKFVTVAKNVKLEVLDWGGTGSPLVFLAGLGDTAHEFDKLAPKFTASHHVYAITRRGYGNSSAPDPKPENYSADRLGDDVLAVMRALKIDRPVLAGHSIAGEELSLIGSKHPEKVSGLVYLDAGYAYAYYVPGGVMPPGENLYIDANGLRDELARLTPQGRDQDLVPIIQKLQILVSQFEKDLSATQAALQTDPAAALAAPPPPPKTRQVEIDDAVVTGGQKFTAINVPILALFEDPPNLPPRLSPAVRAAQTAQFAAQIDAFEAGLPSAHVVRLPNARHALWMTNEADVIREMNAFMDRLPRP